MNKSKEEIIEILKREGMSYKTMTGEYRKVIHEHDFERIAEKILKEETAKDLAVVCYNCKVTKGTNPEGNNFCSMCDHYF